MFSDFRALLQLAWVSDRGNAFRSLVLTAASRVAQVLTAVSGAALLGRVSTGAGVRDVLAASLSLGGLIAASHVLAVLGERARALLDENVAVEIDRRTVHALSHAEDISVFEDPSQLDTIARLQEDRGFLLSVSGLTVNSIATIFRFIAFSVVLFHISPPLALLGAFGVPVFALARWSVQHNESSENAAIQFRRESDALLNLLVSASAGQELKTAGTEDQVEMLLVEAESELLTRRSRSQLVQVALSFSAWMVFGVGIVGASWLIVNLALRGRASASDVLAVVVVAIQLQSDVGAGFATASGLGRAIAAGGRVRRLEMRLPRRNTSADSLQLTEVGRIHLNDVSFTYPGSSAGVLCGITLEIGPGVTAIVGPNGAGKSTLVKLLCGLYAPTEGSVEVRLKDGRSLSVAIHRSSIRACFQDYGRYEFSLREATGIGELNFLRDDDRIRAALSHTPTGAKLSEQLALDSQLGSSWPEGTDLSTGEWQSVAVGRAAIRLSSWLTVVDEPAASLDPEAEAELNRQIMSLGERAWAGPVLLVSHRLLSVKEADRIIVVEAGRITQDGNHETLMSTDGYYRRAYQAGAAAFDAVKDR